ncbi:uncharacterized protein LOC129728870 [Wyeomyia smithii]|uniref:uncharacterized protein LOC129728870 n=1 Tax=Wyeomyia smithii TaxID=174621 RepID=UPI0024680AF4|nr:uncharacterized protein LOC129728870 [Wyeomyia smithii]
MEVNFSFCTSVTALDAALRNAIKLESLELMQRAIERGANVNCQYPDDWNTPLHLAVISSDHCCESLSTALMNHRPNYMLLNGENITAAELAIQRGRKALARQLITAEFGKVEPVDALYAMMHRSSVEALEILIEIMALPQRQLAQCLAKAWSKLEIMNVELVPAIEFFAHMTLIRCEYDGTIGTTVELKPNQTEVRLRMELIVKAISCVENNFDTGLCHDVNDEFLELLRIILSHLFAVKNHVDSFPGMQLEYCLALYIAILDRKPQLDLYQLVVNKCAIVKFLKQLKKSYLDPRSVDSRMSSRVLHKLLCLIHNSEGKKCKDILRQWASSKDLSYSYKEQVMIRNKIFAGSLLSEVHGLQYHDLDKKEQNLLHVESDTINRLFTERRVRFRFKKLHRLYVKLKQMYSLQKAIGCLSLLEGLNLDAGSSNFMSLLAIQRMLQVLGETLKATKLSPNISTNLRSLMEFISPIDILNRITKLRQFFSHGYSSTKHSLYQRLRNNDQELLQLYLRVKTDLMKVSPLIINIYVGEIEKFLNTFLGQILQLNTAEQVQSLAKACQIHYEFKIDYDLETTDVTGINNLLTQLEQYYDRNDHKENLSVIDNIRTILQNYIKFVERSTVDFMTELATSSIGYLIMNDNLAYQKNYAKYILNNRNDNPKFSGYGVKILILHTFNHLLNKLLELEVHLPTEESMKRINIIQNLMKIASAPGIDAYHELVLGNGQGNNLETTQAIVEALQLELTSSDQFKELNKLLSKYYGNLFALDDKYRVLKAFCKRNKYDYDNQKALRCRQDDMVECRAMLSELLKDLNNIIDIPMDAEPLQLISMLEAFERYQIDSPENLALEIILLEVLEILSSQCKIPDNRSSLSFFRSVITGRNLRNYLAHDSLVYETLCRNKNPHRTVILNAICLSRHFDDKVLYDRMTPTPSENVQELISEIELWKHSSISQKVSLFELVTQAKFDLITKCCEIGARTLDKHSLLISTFHLHSVEIIRFLLQFPTKLISFFEVLLEICPNQVHNFYDDDEFTVRQLFSSETLRQNATFYLALKYHHFELENELDHRFGGVYTADSLNMALVFQNQQSALSIINNPRLYDFCKADSQRWDHTPLTQAVIRKLPAVAQILCELSPEMIELTNSAQEAPLYLAVAAGCQECVQILLNFGAKVHTPLKSAIVYAVRMRKDDLLKMMLPSEVELSKDQTMLGELIRQASYTNHHHLLGKLATFAKSSKLILDALLVASSNNNVEAVDAILAFDSGLVNAVSEDGKTALASACSSNSFRTVQQLLRYGADCNLPAENSALVCAIERNYRLIVTLFLRRNLINPIHRATTVEYLLKKAKFRLAWMFFKQGYTCTITNLDIKVHDTRLLKLLHKMCHLKPEITVQIDSLMIVNANLLKSHSFVQFAIDATFHRMSTVDKALLLNGAVKANDKDLMYSLLARGCNVNQPDLIGITPLGLAVSLGKPEVVKMLLKAGADFDQETVANCDVLYTYWTLHGSTAVKQLQDQYIISYPIILAIFHGHIKIAEFLLENNTLPDVRDQRGLTPLVIAIYCGYVKIVKALLSLGADAQYSQNFTHTIFEEGTALHAAAYFGHVEVLKLFIEKHEFDSAKQTEQGDTVLHSAIRGKRSAVVEYLLGLPCWDISNQDCSSLIRIALLDLDDDIFRLIKALPMTVIEFSSFVGSDGKRILHHATVNGSLSMLRTLLNEFNIDVDQLDLHGNRAIFYAVQNRALSKLKFLMDAGSPFYNVKDKNHPLTLVVNTNQIDALKLFLSQNEQSAKLIKNYQTAGYNILQVCAFKNNIAMCELLLCSVDFDVNAVHESGMTALHLASAYGTVQMVALLIRHGSRIDAVNEDDKTPLVVAIEHGNTKVAEYLIIRKASLSAIANYRYRTNQGMCLLHRVSMDGKLDTVKLLLSRNIFERTVPDDTGKNLAHYAAANNRSNIIEYLIKTIFPFDILDNDGRSALVSALEMGHLKIAKRLKTHGSSIKILQTFNEKQSLIDCSNSALVKFLQQECNLANDHLVEIVKTVIGDTSNTNKFALLRTAIDNKNCTEVEKILAQNNLSPDTQDSNGQSLLHYSCESNSLEAVKLLLHLGATIDLEDHQQITPVIASIINGNQSIAEFLISKGASTERISSYRMQTRDQETLLHVVTQKGFDSTLSLLLQLNIFPIDVGDVDQTTALQTAALHGQLECIKLLLANGADPNFVDLELTTSLTRACISCHKEAAELLIAHGVELANPREFRLNTNSKESLLHTAICRNNELIDLLVHRIGINVNVLDNNYMTPLHYAARLGSYDSIIILLSHGAVVDTIDSMQETPLISATLAGHVEVAELLLDKTENIEPVEAFRSQQSNNPLIHIVLEKGFCTLLIRMLTKLKLNDRVIDADGRTILHHAVSQNILSIIEYFYVDIHTFFQRDNYGISPIGIVVQRSDVTMFEKILNSLEAHLDESHLINILKTIVQFESSQSLSLYSRWLIDKRREFIAGNQEIVDIINVLYPSVIIERAILESSHDLLHLFLICTTDKSVIQCKDMPRGMSYLHVAALRNEHQITNLLLRYSGVLVDELDDSHRTPLCYAAMSNSLRTVEILLDHGADVNHHDQEQQTPLLFAIENGNVEMVQLILHFGADAS